MNLKGNISQNFQENTLFGFRTLKIESYPPVNYFPEFWGKNIENYPPRKLFLFTSLALCVSTGGLSWIAISDMVNPET